MSENITVNGVTYPEVDAVSMEKENGGEVLYVDVSQDTVTPEVLAKGYTAHNKAGDKITGTFEQKKETWVMTLTDGSTVNKVVVVE